jgi:hypothetical protein
MLLALRDRVSMKPTRQRHVVLYKRRGETQWAIRHGWIPTDDAESLRQYFATSPDCGEFYEVSGEPINNTLQMFGEIRSDCENKTGALTASDRFAARKAVIERLLRRNKMRVKAGDLAEAELREQFRHITKAGSWWHILPTADVHPSGSLGVAGGVRHNTGEKRSV